jgi:hypothetical protein
MTGDRGHLAPQGTGAPCGKAKPEGRYAGQDALPSGREAHFALRDKMGSPHGSFETAR